MPNVQEKVLGLGRSLTTLLDNHATSEAREDIRRQLRRSLECLVGVHFTEGNAITVLRNGDEIFPAMLEAISKAQHTVDLMTFVYWKGRRARQFADALCERAKAGLRVRVLIDALGGIQIEDGIVEAMEDSGVDVHWYRKLWLNSPLKQNHRGHRKVCIIDETIGFTGGVGIAEAWDGEARNEKEWRGTHFRADGPAVDGLARAFIQDWARTGSPLYDERDRAPGRSPGGWRRRRGGSTWTSCCPARTRTSASRSWRARRPTRIWTARGYAYGPCSPRCCTHRAGWWTALPPSLAQARSTGVRATLMK